MTDARVPPDELVPYLRYLCGIAVGPDDETTDLVKEIVRALEGDPTNALACMIVNYMELDTLTESPNPMLYAAFKLHAHNEKRRKERASKRWGNDAS